ncbi:MAG: Gldg family protein [Deltaproteobacteria bacterium]|nr:Gldg family protein [Deltaproteobacteria bacterium]
MKHSWAISRREIGSFFHAPRSYLFLSAAVCIWGFYFLNLVGRYNFLVARAAGMQLDQALQIPTLQQFVISAYFQLVLASLAVLVPLLAMRTFAEERETGTLELLLTAPISAMDIVVGKFLALSAQVLCFVSLSAIFPLSLFYFGAPDRGALLSGILGLTLCGFAFAASGLAVSARCERQLSAAVASICINSALLLLHTPAAILPSSLRNILEVSSAYLESSAFFDGYISAQGIGYFLLLVLVGLWAAHASVSMRSRSSLNRAHPGSASHAPFGSISVALTLLMGGVLLGYSVNSFTWWPVLLEFAVGGTIALLYVIRTSVRSDSLPRLLSATLRVGVLLALFCIAVRSRKVWDVSDLRAFTLSPRTLALVKQLRQSVEVRYVLRGSSDEDRRATRFLAQFVAANPTHIQLTMVDPVEYVDLLGALGIRQGTVVQIVGSNEGSPQNFQLPRLEENAIAAALEAVLNPVPQKVLVWEAAGAARLEDTGPYGLAKFGLALEGEGFQVQSLPEAVEALPNDGSIVVLVGPRSLPSAQVLQVLNEFLLSGGKLFLCIDPIVGSAFRDLLQPYGIQLVPGVLVDHEQASFSRGRAGLQPLISALSEHPITNTLGSARAVIMNSIATFRLEPASNADVTAREILFSSAGSYVENDVVAATTGRKSFSTKASETEGLAVGAVVELQQKPALTVYGDSDWVLNSALEFYSNYDLALNSLQWLAQRDWALTPRTKRKYAASVALSGQAFTQVMVGTVLLAQAILLFGILSCRRPRTT